MLVELVDDEVDSDRSLGENKVDLAKTGECSSLLISSICLPAIFIYDNDDGDAKSSTIFNSTRNKAKLLIFKVKKLEITTLNVSTRITGEFSS